MIANLMFHQSDDEDSDNSESDSDDSDDSDESDSEKKAAAPSKKRKADDEEVVSAKKTKTEDESDERSSTLWIGNLSFKVDDNSLYEEFQSCTGLTGARVVSDRETGRSRGFGYIDFASADDAQAAFDAKTGQQLDGRDMRLDFSSSKPKTENRSDDRAKKFNDTISPESDTLFVGNLPFHADEDTVSAFFNEVCPVKSLRLPTDR